jgi:hypothetical protein
MHDMGSAQQDSIRAQHSKILSNLPSDHPAASSSFRFQLSLPAYPDCHLVVLIVAAQNKTRWSALEQIQFICASARLQLHRLKLTARELKRLATHASWILARTENISPELHNSNTNMAWWCHRLACQQEDLYRLSTKQNMQYSQDILQNQFIAQSF